jgi:hypothetical protein
MSLSQLYRGGTFVLSILMIALGVIMIATTLFRGGGPLAIGVFMGILFSAVGVGRLYIHRKSH